MGATFGACGSQDVQAETEEEVRIHSSSVQVAAEDAAQSSMQVVAEGSPWAQLGGEELESALHEGLVKCLDSRYVVELAGRGKAFARRQDMPEEAYVGLDKLKEMGVYSKKVFEGGRAVLYQWLPLMIVSYAWLSPNHPDRYGETLRVLAKALEHMECHGVIIDFTALPQVPRDDFDNKTFKKGLPCLNRFYSHPHVLVLKVSQFPEGYPRSRPYDLPEGHEPVEYSSRGWCFAEAAMAGLCKSPKFVCDVSHLSPGTHVVGGSVVLPRPPMIPAKFNIELGVKTFTQPKVDSVRVQELYRTAFNERVRGASSLMYSNVEWGPAEISTFAKAMVENERAETLELSQNNVGEEGMQALAEVLRTHKALNTLHLARCRLGPGAARELAQALQTSTVLTTLNIQGNEIGDEGARWLAEALRTNANTAVTLLSLRANQIGDEGTRWLAEVLKTNTTLTTLQLGSNQIGDKGARWLAEALPTATLTALHLGGNKIRDEGAKWLAEALRTNRALTTLDVGNNQIGDEGVRCLAEIAPLSTCEVLN